MRAQRWRRWPDRELRHEPGCCGRCGAGLASRPVTGVERRQVFDLPEITVTVTASDLATSYLQEAATANDRRRAGIDMSQVGTATYALTARRRSVVRAVLATSVRSQGLIRLLPGEAGTCRLAVTLPGGTVGEVTGQDKGGLR
jgi:hypothetical protein